MPDRIRFKVIFLFLIQGAVVFALSFTHRYMAVAMTLVLLAVALGFWISRDLLTILSKKSPQVLEEDTMDYDQKVKVSDMAKSRKLEESEQERVFIANTYATMKKEIQEEKDVVQAEKEELSMQKEEMEKLLNIINTTMRSVPDGVAMIDSERKVVRWNPGAQKISGWEESRAETTHYSRIFKFFDKNDKAIPGDECPVEECFRTGQMVERAGLFLQAKSGSQKPIEITVTPITEDRRQVKGVVVTFRDISKKLEVEKFKEEFLAMVTHDLKSPLAAIVGYTNLLLHPRANFSQDEHKNFLTSILGSVKILQFLIDNILESSRLESGRINYHFEDFDLSGLMQEIEMMFTPIVNSKQVRLEFKGSSIWVLGDREKLREVINNLISNAVKFTPEGGKIKVEYFKLDTFAEIKVSDTGKGIPSEELPKLFNKFVQVKGEKRGTGLGLYIVKRILEDHGQKIDVTLDYDLPDINGEEVIKRLNKINGKIHIPIMIITGNIKKNWEIEYDCLLYKPVDESRFIQEVDRLLNRGETSIKSVEVLQ